LKLQSRVHSEENGMGTRHTGSGRWVRKNKNLEQHTKILSSREVFNYRRGTEEDSTWNLSLKRQNIKTDQKESLGRKVDSLEKE